MRPDPSSPGIWFPITTMHDNENDKFSKQNNPLHVQRRSHDRAAILIATRLTVYAGHCRGRRAETRDPIDGQRIGELGQQ